MIYEFFKNKYKNLYIISIKYIKINNDHIEK